MAPKAMKKAFLAMRSMKAKGQALTKRALAQALADTTKPKKSYTLAVLGSLASVVGKEVKNTCKLVIPVICMVTMRVKLATKAGKREMSVKIVVVQAKPAKTVVKAFAVAALKKAV